MNQKFYNSVLESIRLKQKLLAILIDPEKFKIDHSSEFLQQIPQETTHVFVGGSTVSNGETEKVVQNLKTQTTLPVFLFPGDYSQITPKADAVLFLNLISGRNPEYLIGQHVKSVPEIYQSGLEIISTGYILIHGGNQSSVARVTNTNPLIQDDIETIVHTALAGEYMGAKMIYLEAGSGAKIPVKPEIIYEVKKCISIPLITGGGIRTSDQRKTAFEAGADMVVMGTVFEELRNR